MQQNGLNYLFVTTFKDAHSEPRCCQYWNKAMATILVVQYLRLQCNATDDRRTKISNQKLLHRSRYIQKRKV